MPPLVESLNSTAPIDSGNPQSREDAATVSAHAPVGSLSPIETTPDHSDSGSPAGPYREIVVDEEGFTPL